MAAGKNYAKLAQMIIKGGTSVVLAGGPDDAPKGEEIVKGCQSDKLINLIGQTSLRELAALIKGSVLLYQRRYRTAPLCGGA